MASPYVHSKDVNIFLPEAPKSIVMTAFYVQKVFKIEHFFELICKYLTFP